MNKNLLSDGIIELRLKRVERQWFFPLSYSYGIFLCANGKMIGRCDYRCLNNEENYYGGNIGYIIFPDYRGYNYALAAARLLCKLAATKTKELIITCSPENIASYKTIIKLGGTFIEEVKVPTSHYLYRQGERVKDIFKIDLQRYS